ncbi:MAG: c-type cytochrome [Saprospiraceae bacterium]|nr:c-type cytochrome [Saprospiraceae bacterium]
MKSLFLLALCSLLVLSCKKSDDPWRTNFDHYTPEDYALISEYLNLPETPYSYNIEPVRHLAIFGIIPTQQDADMVTLGRVLFYDKSLSSTGTISCASCHHQEYAFGDNKSHSLGVNDRASKRNSMALGAVINFTPYYDVTTNGPNATRFFWDNRAGTAMEQIREAMNNPDEMDMNPHQITASVQAKPYYRPLFEKAFVGGAITEENIVTSIRSYVNALFSGNSRFDQAWINTDKVKLEPLGLNPFKDFTQQENHGKSLYMINCAVCHGPTAANPLVSSGSNGLDLQPVDLGIGGVNGLTKDMGVFKNPPLRNIAQTAPYMHDGRFATLEEVVDHYSSGIKAHENLHFLLREPDGNPKQMHFTQEEKEAIVAFLHTLTDQEFLTAVKYADPFK